MRIDITSFFFNTTIPDATATAAWGTAVCFQDKEKTYKIKDNDLGLVDLMIGMNYKVCSDIENLDISKMKTSELLFFSIFDKVYINGIKIENNFILLFLKEQSQTHKGRLRISYPSYASYDNNRISNQKAISEFEKVLNVNGGSWFVYDISVINQDELHFSAIVVNATKPMTYKTSKERGEIWKNLIDEKEPLQKNLQTPFDSEYLTQQVIYYGAPGTGKSYKVDKIIENLDLHYYERITFHPEYDNASFIGGYKPISEKDSSGNDTIKYKFVPQAFTNIYKRAWQDLENPYFLVIEEINRGNCAEIFGEIFQLLDRNSSYTVTPSKELKEYLINEAFEDENHLGIVNGLKLPPNLSILATMNTSDQSLFPMDSAFKRRWDWEYIPICYTAIDDFKKKNDSFDFEIDIEDGKKYSWIKFIEKINLNHIKVNPSLGMDKCIGNYFIKPDNGNVISLKPFVNKVIFYLWNDVFKDEDNKVFEENTSYEDFFPIETNGKKKIKELFDRIDLKAIPSLEIVEDENPLGQVAESPEEMES